MAKSKPRKKYVPKPVVWDTMQFVKTGMAPASTATKTVLSMRMKNISALERLKLGTGLQSDVVDLTHTMITAQSIAGLDVGGSKEYVTYLDTAQEALLTIATRFGVWKKIQATPLELDDIVYAVQIHDAQLDVCTISELEKAIILAKTAIQCNHPEKRKFDTRETV